MNVDTPEDADSKASAALNALRRAQEAGAAAVARGGRELVSARAELAHAKAHLVLMDRARRTERVARERQVAKARAEISGLRKELEDAAGTPAIKTPVLRGSGSRNRLMLSLVAIIALAAIAGLCVRYADPLHTWDGRGHVSVVPRPADALTKAAPRGRQGATSSAETHALSRLGDAMGMVPAQAMPSVLKAANQWLDNSGEQACSVASAGGGASLVISGNSGDQPLLAALSRCAQAVEHLMQETPEK